MIRLAVTTILICIVSLTGGCEHTPVRPPNGNGDTQIPQGKNSLDDVITVETSPAIKIAHDNYGDTNFYIQVKLKDRSGAEQAFRDCVNQENESLIRKLFQKLRQIGFSSAAQMTLLIKLSGDAQLTEAEKIPVLTVAFRESPPEGEPKCRVSILEGPLSPLLVATAHKKVTVHYELRVSDGDHYTLFSNAADAAKAYMSFFGSPTWLLTNITPDVIKSAGSKLDYAVNRVVDSSGVIDKQISLAPYQEAHTSAISNVKIDLAEFRHDWAGHEMKMLKDGPFWTQIYLEPVGSLFHIRNGSTVMWNSPSDILQTQVSGVSGAYNSLEQYLRNQGKVRPEDLKRATTHEELIDKCSNLKEIFRADLNMTRSDALVARYAVMREFAPSYTITEEQKARGDRCFSHRDHLDLVSLNPTFSLPIMHTNSRDEALRAFFDGTGDNLGFSDRLKSRNSRVLRPVLIDNRHYLKYYFT